mmetsp:Transcript_30025/g.30476  ORF Transcript_30025/g.30476 Transcript_30025/m.30476 type:complete len:384 (+) Transcript_30025:209-1360(+)
MNFISVCKVYGKGEIPVDAVAAEDAGGKYKSAINIDTNHLHNSAPQCRQKISSEIPPAKDMLSSSSKELHTHDVDEDSCSNNICLEPSVPMRPDFIFCDHFRAVDQVPLKLDELTIKVHNALAGSAYNAIEFISSDCLWNVVFVCGSSSYKAQIHIYQDFEESFIVEAQRLSGDSASFRTMYRQLKDAITGSKCSLQCSARVYPLPDVPALSEGEMVESLAPVVSMAKDQYLECQQSAAQVLCDLSQHEGMHNILCEAGCVEALVGLVRNGMDCTRQHAVLALANLSSSQSCQEAIISEGVLPALLSLVTNGPCSSTVMGRESARLLANLSDRLASRVFSALDAEELKLWMASVDDLNDSFLKQQAERARCALSAVIDVSTQG